jgi:membrane protein
MKLGGASLWFLAKRLIKEAGDDDLSGAAAELAYRFFLALFPFFIFLAALGGFIADTAGVDNPTDEVMDWLGDTLPEDANSVLRTQLDTVVQEQNPALLSLGIIGAVRAAASGVGTVMKSMNRVYEVKETRPMWQRYGLSVGLTLLGGLFVSLAFVLLVVGQVAGMSIAEKIGLEGPAAFLLTLARWPLIIALLMAAMAYLYWAAPNVDLPFKWITPGAVVFTIGWLLVSYLFGLYVANFGAYNATYGTLGGVVVLLIWFYLTAFILVLGGEINAVVAQEAVPEELPQSPEEGATPETVPDHRKTDRVAGLR